MKRIFVLMLCLVMVLTATASFGAGKHFEIIVKSYQSSYWQAAVTGVNQEASKLGLEIHLICFDSGIPNAPEGSVYATIATDNYGAGATAAINLYAGLKEKILAAKSPVRIGEVNPDATSESITSRGLGFIDKFCELAKADGKKVAVIGNEYFTNNCKDKGSEEGADIIIEVAVPAQTTADLCATEASVILNKSDTIGIFGSNQISAEGILTSDENLGVLGSDPSKSILAAGFDAGSVIKEAVRSGVMYGAVTQSPLMIGITTVETLKKISDGEKSRRYLH